ncbi:sulfatase [Nibrella saemangeumensis]|uniref:Sulfatase n=1 Tax=Nibrella saemangeumensis TaxID=1084526 RepID=A0ABP8NMX5_9BACT
MRKSVTALAIGLFLLLGYPGHPQTPGKYNVLFITVDDLRPLLGCYGDTLVKTPNIDKLASRGLLFNRAYCQQAVCAPSRASLLTGKRPETIRIFDLETPVRKAVPDVVTLPQLFKNAGYHTLGMGKIFHHPNPASFSQPEWYFSKALFSPQKAEEIKDLVDSLKASGVDWSDWKNRRRGPAFEAPEVPDSLLMDGELAVRAMEQLRQLKKGAEAGTPFFLALGFLKPHLPFVAPRRYWELYDPARIPPAPNPYLPVGAPAYAQHSSGELRTYDNISKGKAIDAELSRELKHGYLAAVSFVDAQVGLVLDKLQRLGLDKTTIVVLWGDHGFQLGEHNMWCKHNNYEISTRAPLIVSVPGMRHAGQATNGLVEFVDVYPTLADYAGLPVANDLEGISLRPLIEQPRRAWKKAAFSLYPWKIPGVGDGFGYTLRTDRYRLVEWTVPEKGFYEYELYDHQTDTQENKNLAALPAYRPVMERLKKQLHQGWKKALP